MSEQDQGVTPSGPGLRPFGVETAQQAQAEPLVPNAASVAEALWNAEARFSLFEDDLSDLIGEFDSLGHDCYDGSLEIFGVPEDVRLCEAAQRLIREAGFHRVFVNHGPKGDDRGRWETHYTLSGDASLPVRGWRRRYVVDPSAATTRVLAGPVENGYYEISYWPEGWGDASASRDLANGYYRIVPDSLDPLASGIVAAEGGRDPEGLDERSEQSPVAKPDAQTELEQ